MSELSTEDKEAWQTTLLVQYADAYDEAQKQYDASVRTLAAGGLAVTVSLATALHTLNSWGTAAVGFFLLTLLLNLFSFQTALADLKKRHGQANEGDVASWEWNEWTTRTTWLNRGAGGSVFAGAALLGWFVLSAT